MKQTKVVGWGLLAVLGLAMLAGIGALAEEPTYSLAGVGFIVFGIWAAVLLLGNDKK